MNEAALLATAKALLHKRVSDGDEIYEEIYTDEDSVVTVYEDDEFMVKLISGERIEIYALTSADGSYWSMHPDARQAGVVYDRMEAAIGPAGTR